MLEFIFRGAELGIIGGVACVVGVAVVMLVAYGALALALIVGLVVKLIPVIVKIGICAVKLIKERRANKNGQL